MSKISYRDSGVDVEAGDQLVDWLIESEGAGKDGGSQKKPAPRADQVVSGIGGFAAVFRAQFSHMKKPCLVAATDGIGTKILLASHARRYGEVAQDLVAMCGNDLVCSGAEPLFFLDYYATSKLEPQAAKEFLHGVRRACEFVNCALIGGEKGGMSGVYKPGTDRTATFSIPAGLHIYGGFLGTETSLSQRNANPLNVQTTLSGSIGSSAASDDCYTVVTLDNVDSNTVVDGFYIARGYNNGGPWSGYGAGMGINYATSPTIRNCDFTTNTASLGGGALHLVNATVKVINCTFYKSSVYNGSGGAIDSVGPIHTTLTLQNCRFLGNHALGDGGAIYTNFVHAEIANCLFSGNDCDNAGGAIKSVGDTQWLKLWGGTFSMNAAGTYGGGVYASGGIPVELHNHILWGNTGGQPAGTPSQQITAALGSTQFGTNNTVEGLDANPLFVNAAGNDGLPGNFDDDLRLSQASPCIDSGDAAAIPLDVDDMNHNGITNEPIPFDFAGNPGAWRSPPFPTPALPVIPGSTAAASSSRSPSGATPTATTRGRLRSSTSATSPASSTRSPRAAPMPTATPPRQRPF